MFIQGLAQGLEYIIIVGPLLTFLLSAGLFLPRSLITISWADRGSLTSEAGEAKRVAAWLPGNKPSTYLRSFLTHQAI